MDKKNSDFLDARLGSILTGVVINLVAGAVILPRTELEGARAVGENIRRRISEEKFPGEETQPGGDLTITLGLAVFPADGQAADEIIESADQALYEGKRAGRNRLVVYGEMGPPTPARPEGAHE